MDAVSYSHADKQKQRIEKFIEQPDSTSGIVTVPDTIASGESIEIATGRQIVVDHLDVQGTLDIQGTLATVSGGYLSQTTMKTQAIAHTNGTNAMTIDSSGNVMLGSNYLTPYTGFKNYIINGNFDVWQYGTSQTSSGYGSDDRWGNFNVVSTKTHSRVACTDTERALFNASYFSRTVVSSVAGASSQCGKYQAIEDVTRLAGKTITLSFWAKADSNKNIAVEPYFDENPGSSTGTFSAQIVSLTTIWQKKTITLQIPTLVGKTLGTNNSMRIHFWFDAGSNLNSRTANLGQQSGTFDIAQVQLEEGSVATPFEQRPYGLELSLCKRYYHKYTIPTGQVIGTGMCQSATNAFMNFQIPSMRTTPTVTASGGLYLIVGNSQFVYTGIGAVYSTGDNMYTVGITVSSGLTAGYAVSMLGFGSNAILNFSAEL